MVRKDSAHSEKSAGAGFDEAAMAPKSKGFAIRQKRNDNENGGGGLRKAKQRSGVWRRMKDMGMAFSKTGGKT